MMRWQVAPIAPPQSPTLAELLAPYSTHGLDFARATVARMSRSFGTGFAPAAR